MQKVSQDIIYSFRKKKKLSKRDLEKILKDDAIDDISTHAQIMASNGLPIYEKEDFFYLKTLTTLYEQEIFCFVDIETNGSKPQDAQIIEIAGIKVQNGKIIDKFESFIYNKNVPKHIQEITNISTELLKDAPSQKDVLSRFKIFLADSVFLAHSVSFDYNFISFYLEKFHLGKLENRRICTLVFAQKMIESEKYSLSFFNGYLKLGQENLHRAYADSFVSFKLFQECLKDVPKKIETTEDLIKFIHN